LTANVTGRGADVFLRDLQVGTTTLVSVSPSGTGSRLSNMPIISPDGRFVVFRSDASTTNFTLELFMRDVAAGTTTLISETPAGSEGNGDSYVTLDAGVDGPYLSADGRYVVFRSTATDLVSNDYNQAPDLFVRDVLAGDTILVSRRDPNRPSLTPGGSSNV